MSATLAKALGSIALTLVACAASAQVQTVPRHVGSSKYPYGDSSNNPIAILTEHQKAGDWERLHRYGLELIQSMAKIPPLAGLLGDIKNNYYSLVWQSTGADGKPVINRVLVHDGLTAQHASRLPGLRTDWTPQASSTPASPFPSAEGITSARGPELLDVLLTDAPARLTSVYTFTPTANPLVTQLPDVVSKLNVIGFLAASAGTGDVASTIEVSVNQPDLVLGRASIQIKDAISTPVQLDAMRTDATRTLASVLLRQARTSACARSAANAMKTAIDNTTAASTCTGASTDAERRACATATKNAVESAFATTVGACPPETGSGVGFDPVIATELEFKNLVVAGGARVVSGTSTLTNTPLTRYSYGLVGGLLVGHPRLKESRVKVDGGKLVKAPIDHTLTMLVVNIHPSPYDAEWPRVSWSERFRLYAGAVLTPDFGATVGIGVGLVRGLSVNTGLAFMASNRLKSGEQLDQPPLNKNDPFRLQLATAGYVGFGYVFK